MPSSEVPRGDAYTEVQMYGTIAPLTGQTHYRLGDVLSKTTFATFLCHWIRYYRGEQHRSAPGKAVEQKVAWRLGLTPQPVSAPELHPEERISKRMRRVV